ncbi:MAG: discoidin domain-containing protein [Planctomycetes bacterium]|nr:discoidin domain-containing protein [Planctomycetota bacterium]
MTELGVRMKTRWIGILALIAAGSDLRAQGPAVSKGDLSVSFRTQSRSIEIIDEKAGPILSAGSIAFRAAGRDIATDKDAPTSSAEDAQRAAIVLRYAPDVAISIRVADEERVEIRAEGSIEGSASFRATAAGDALIALLDDQKEADRSVLTLILGPAEVPIARSIYDPSRDLAVGATAAAGARWVRGEGGAWVLRSVARPGASLLSLRVRRDYYRKTLGIAFHAPIRKRPRWPVAPAVAMTWYGIEGWKGSPAQTKAWLFPQIDWVAANLLPYAGTLVFQLDDNYAKDDDRTMREIADYIRSKGLVPGIWFTPYVVAPAAETEAHPTWFIHDPDGKPIGTFGGVSYGGRSTLNVTNAEAVASWFGMWWRKASDTWGFDFFKIDGQPNVIAAYRKATDGGGVDGYRKGLAIARGIVGPEKFINACWGIPLEAIGLVDGSRTGGDTGNDPHALDVIIRWNFLNNVCWWCDPDAAANLFRATVERARLNAQARVLTGQQFLTDDVWTKVPPAIASVWQRSYPALDIRPANLYRIENWKDYDLFDLKIAKPWGTWDVVGLFNAGGAPAAKVLDLGRLALLSRSVHVFEYWTSTYLGVFRRDAEIPRLLDAYEGQLFAVVPEVEGRPLLVSTSRHASQGGLDLDAVEWAREGERWIARGTSSHLVAGDPYEIVFATGPYAAVAGTASSGEVEATRAGGVTRIRTAPAQAGAIDWQVAFERSAGAALDLFPAMCDLRPGSEGTISIVSLGMEGCAWKARATDPRIRVTPAEGEIGPWPARAAIAVSADASGLEPGSVWAGAIEAGGARAAVRLHVPPPENVARRAKATASSSWGPGYEAERANDGLRTTRWNSAQGDKDGCWIELAWAKPVAFDRIVIDECMDFGPRIEAWRLEASRAGEAGSAEMVEIARGTGAGARATVKLAAPIAPKRLRLTIEKASVVPTIWELEVYDWKAVK